MAETLSFARSLKDLVKNHTIEEWAESFVTLGMDGDRSMAILASVMVERGLENVLLQHIVPISKTEYDQLFEGVGPLSSFSNKIKIAYAIGALSKDARHDLDLIREIRNTFAHSVVQIDFNEAAIARRCRDLKLGSRMIKGNSIIVDLSCPRTSFQYNTRLYASILLAYGSDAEQSPSRHKPAL